MMGAKFASREMDGQVAGRGTLMFKSMWLQAFVQRPRWMAPHKIQVLHMAVDPCGGGAASDWAICTLAFEDCKTIVRIGSSNM